MRGLRGPKAHTICELPQKVTMQFGKSGTPLRKHVKPYFRRKGQERCLAKLQIDEYNDKEVTVTLPEKLACYGPGRYEICTMDICCQQCDCIEIVFQAKCEIVDCSVTAIEEPYEQCN